MGRFIRKLAAAWGLAISLAISLALACPAFAEGGAHIVAPGDTLSALARRYGVSVAAIAEANGLANPNLIYVGQRLAIPSAAVSPPGKGEDKQSPPAEGKLRTSTLHVVEAGDTLGGIARLYGTTVPALAEANELSNPDRIYPGQALVIPAEGAGEASWVEVYPSPARPGDTLLVRLPMEKVSSLQGSLGGRPLRFLEEKDYRWALVGLGAWTAPGEMLLTLSWTGPSGEGGELTKTIRVLRADFPVERISLSPEKAALLDPQVVRQENERLQMLSAEFTPKRLWEGRFLLPLEGRFTSPFGSGRSYDGGPAASRHEGLDIAAPEGTPVRAAAAGRVVLAGELAVRGRAVLLDHGAGVFSGYYHLSRVSVKAGDEIGQGEILGEVGSTGLSTGPHLHWELRVGGVHVSPLGWTQASIPR